MKDAEKYITVSLAELCLKHRKAGIKEVVEWVKENVGYNGMTTLDENWQAKLKEWGV